MARNTKFLNLYEIEPSTDGNLLFDIQKMLNDNWDKIENSLTIEQLILSPNVTYTQTLRTLSGDLDEWKTVLNYNGTKFLEIIETEKVNEWVTEFKYFNQNSTRIKTVIETFDNLGNITGRVEHA